MRQDQRGKRGWAVGVLGLAALTGLWGCAHPADPWEGETASRRVVVSIAPLYSFVRAVAKDRVAIRCLCTTTGPHHYQADTRDARVLNRADLLLAVGLKLDDNFADAMRSMARRPDLRYIKIGQRLPEKSLMPMSHSHDHDHAGGHHHHHGKWDPHIWLGLPEAVAMVGVIRDELTHIDPDHADEYRHNAEAHVKQLQGLHEEGKKLLGGAKGRRIISFHEALGYLARSFSLEVAGVIEQGPGDEPTSVHLARIVELCQDRSKPIAAITVEPQYPRSTSATVVQKELKSKGFNVPLVEIDPLETADAEQLSREGAGWYVKRMRENLEALAGVLK